MHTGIATASPTKMITTDGNGTCAPSSAMITESDTIAPIMTTSPCAKLISPMMPYTIV